MKKITIFFALLFSTLFAVSQTISGSTIDHLTPQTFVPASGNTVITVNGETRKIDIQRIIQASILRQGFGTKISQMFVNVDSNAIATKYLVEHGYVPRSRKISINGVEHNLDTTASWIIAGSGGGNGVDPLDVTVSTTGLNLDIVIPLYGYVATGVQVLSKNGTGVLGFDNDTINGNIIIHYSSAPKNDVHFLIGRTVASGGATTMNIGATINTSGGATVDNTIRARNMSVARNMHMQYVRRGYSDLGVNVVKPDYTYYLDSGFKVLLTYNTAPVVVGDATPYPTDTGQFRFRIDSFFNINPLGNVEVLFFQNEEVNYRYWSGPASLYLTLLDIFIDEMHKRGKKVSNGGLIDDELKYLVYKDYINRGFSDSALDFKNRTIGVGVNVSGWEADATRGPYIRKMDTCLTRYATNGLDYVNVHFYWPEVGDSSQAIIDSYGFKQVVWYVNKRTGKQVISNELGQFNTQPGITQQILTACRQLNMPYVAWYSVDGPGRAIALNNLDGSLRSTGITVKNFIDAL